MQRLENCLEPLSFLWVTEQEPTGLGPGVSTVLTGELTAANSSHLRARRNASVLWQRAGRMQTRSRRETAGSAVSQGHEGVSRAVPEPCGSADRGEGTGHTSVGKKWLLSQVGACYLWGAQAPWPSLIFTKSLKRRRLKLCLMRLHNH